MAARVGARKLARRKYDYRAQWVSFTKRLGSLVTLDDLTPRLVGTVVETVGAPGSPRALPMARTIWPTFSFSESPRVANGTTYVAR